MAKKKAMPPDQPVRDRLLTDFDRNFLVEAGAGSGKTHSLATRMAAGIAAGKYRVEHMAAVTFTRKAAAELRGRFQLALEDELERARRSAGLQPGREARIARIEHALANLERLFAGTIHAFCAHLLRERPVDARVAPGFVELDDVENLRRQRQAWNDYVAEASAEGGQAILDLREAGIRPPDLYNAFAAVCEHEDVEFDMGGGEPPDFDVTLAQVESFWRDLAALKPPAFAPGTKCPAQKKFDELDGRLYNVRSWRRMSLLAGLLGFWNNTKVTQKWWGEGVGRDKAFGKDAKALVEAFQTATVDPFLEQWRAYVHRLAMVVLIEARQYYAQARRRQNAVNYVDLLSVAARTLRSNAAVRQALGDKYRWLFIDEFQDTDPIQAEIFLMLAADETAADVGAGFSRPDSVDPFSLPLRPGALFVVGDPKQSIYRFRRADVDIYNRVATRIKETGGHVLPLTANFRSLPGVCALANTVFPLLFGALAPPYSPAFEALEPVRIEPSSAKGAPVMRITLPAPVKGVPGEPEEARRIAAFIHGEVTSGRRAYGDFLVLTRQRPRLHVYADALDALEIPVEVSGAGLFCDSAEVKALALLLDALGDPLDAVSLVGVLRGPLFGVSDPELFQYRQAGGRFDLLTPLPAASEAADASFGPALAFMQQLQGLYRLTRTLPLPAAVEHLLETIGWLALAATTPSGAGAGHLLQAVDRVREVVEQGGGLADAAGALDEEDASSEAEALALEPGRRDVVRLMNLHKAKGLEAPVVILADPAHAYTGDIVLRIARDGGVARGYLKIMSGEDEPWKRRTLGQPADWAAHEAEEDRYLQAERLRLLYVAGTRAKDLLVVCRTQDPAKNIAWAEFESYLTTAPELKVPEAELVAAKPLADVSKKARRQAAAAREARHERLCQPSWASTSVTAAKTFAAGSGHAVAADERRVDAGAAWGTLIHGLLEHAMRHESTTRPDLERLARWLTVESVELRPFIPEAIELVEAVSKAPFWAEARGGGEVHVEVPFAAAAEPVAGIPAILRGVIDLVHRAGDGWRILDYKTDQIGATADADDELRVRYGAQIEQYRRAWGQAAGEEVVSSGLVAVRAARIVQIPR